MKSILRLDASAKTQGSQGRQLGDDFLSYLKNETAIDLQVRDLGQRLDQLDQTWVEANFTAADVRSDAQAARLETSDALVKELFDMDVLVITLPLYNFGVPAALKAWIDLICRAKLTFRFVDGKPQGLVTGKRAIVILTSGGVAMGAEDDFATPLVRRVLSFIGIDDQLFLSGKDPDIQAKLAQAAKDLAAS